MIEIKKNCKKNPVRDYLSVETSIFRHIGHAVGMPPYLGASLRDAVVMGRCFSTERYIPMECLQSVPPSFPPKGGGLANAVSIDLTPNPSPKERGGARFGRFGRLGSRLTSSPTPFKNCVQPNSPSFGGGWGEVKIRENPYHPCHPRSKKRELN